MAETDFGRAVRLYDRIRQQQAEIDRLQGAVDKLPKCWRLNDAGVLVQDMVLLPGMEVWHWAKGQIWEGRVAYITESTARIESTCPDGSDGLGWTKVFDSREAATAAGGE